MLSVLGKKFAGQKLPETTLDEGQFDKIPV